MKFQILSSIKEIDKESWNALTDPNFPFFDYEFLLALEQSHVVGEKVGQVPLYLCAKIEEKLVASTVLYLKNHSYGEYIFDWGWADAYSRYGIPYYPKLMLYSPFTPAVGNKILAKEKRYKEELLSFLIQFSHAQETSSFHALFISEEERELFLKSKLKERLSVQYHFRNEDYKDFDNFLQSLKMRKRKAIIKERKKIINENIKIELVENESLESFVEVFYKFYLKTIDKKYGMAYLNLEFFKQIFKKMQQEIKLFVAIKENNVIGVSLCFRKGDKLYGRYWGGDERYPFLHFELCYYSPLEFALKENIKIFEAGAQGEHKIARGFNPVKIYSYHAIDDQNFKLAIENFIDEERIQMMGYIDDLKNELAYKN